MSDRDRAISYHAIRTMLEDTNRSNENSMIDNDNATKTLEKDHTLKWHVSCSNEGMMTNEDHRNTGTEKRTYRIMFATAILMAALITSGCVTTGDSVGSSSRFRHGHHHVYSHAPNHRGAHWKSPNHRNGLRGPAQHHSRSFRNSGSGKRR